jgi:N-methylhydantoinase A
MSDLGWRIGVDIGGTFTDLVAERGAERRTAKLLTTHDAPERAVRDGVAKLMAEGAIASDQLGSIVHGTTLATNALIERRGARTALITTEGFRDVLEIGTETRFDHYNLDIDKPEPLIPRPLRIGIKERLSASGDVLVPIDLDEVEAIVSNLNDQGVESVAIAFLHSFKNPIHEQAARERINKVAPDMFVSVSSEVSPEMREYERFSTTTMNAYLQPKVAGYLRNLERSFVENGLHCPVYLMLSNGGLTDIETAIRYPVRLVESGPAGGAILASYVARESGISDVLSFDMGGTTAKICLFDDASPLTVRDFEVARAYRFKKGSGLPVRIPVVEMVEIGAGGGSLAHVSGVGVITVGPESAGSEPGPACYGRGGEKPTITDSNLVIGRIAPDHFAGGSMRIDPAASVQALRKHVATPLGLDETSAALGVIEMVDENMSNAAHEHAAERGIDIAGDRTMIAFGGSAPLHAARLAQKLGIRRVIVPVDAGVASALGFLRAAIGFETVRSAPAVIDGLGAAGIDELLTEMEQAATALVARGVAKGTKLVTRRRAAMRYVGQRHEIMVSLPEGRLDAVDPKQLRAEFEAAYGRQFARTIPKLQIEALSWSVLVEAYVAPPKASQTVPEKSYSGPQETRPVVFPGTVEPVSTVIVERHALQPGDVLEGPAIVVEKDTSTVVPVAFTVSVNGSRHLVLTNR